MLAREAVLRLSERAKTPLTFIHALRFEDLPNAVVAQAERCLLDLIGVAAAGRQTALSRIVHDFAVSQMGSSASGARLILDGRRVSVSGAAYAGAATIDSVDAHDGHPLTKGHCGVALLPTLLAFAEQTGLTDGREFITCLVMGYEIATRAGMALHATARDYHTSGAWNALGCAAIGARLLRLDESATRHALGTAEYHGPRSQMMRCIDHPTMVKDGSGWGALAGASAACLAAQGFTGAPALLIETEEEAPFWRDLGTDWEITRHYLKPYPVCRWAHPAIDATAALIQRHSINAGEIANITIRTFAEAVRLGARAPCTTEEAQYAIAFPVAAIATRGTLGAAELDDQGLRDPDITEMLARVSLIEDASFSGRFPSERWASVEITLHSGERIMSPPTAARGDPEHPLTDDEVRAKFRKLANVLPAQRRAFIEQSVFHLDNEANAGAALIQATLAPA